MSLMNQLAIVVLLAACSSSSSSNSPDPGSTGPDAGTDGAVTPCVPPAGNTAPTYTELYMKYFAVGTEGHCAKSGCHSSTGFATWSCGADKDTCYRGMVKVKLIDPSNPTASEIGDPLRSRLKWVNPNGIMPQDRPGPFNEGRDAILAWVAACAQNN